MLRWFVKRAKMPLDVAKKSEDDNRVVTGPKRYSVWEFREMARFKEY